MTWTAEHRRKATNTLKLNADRRRRDKIARLPFEELSCELQKMSIMIEQNHVCGICGIEEKWNGKTLKFKLNKIDIDMSEDDRDNVRMVCPNCHSQH